MKIISEASKEKIITMCGANQFSHHASAPKFNVELDKKSFSKEEKIS
ncbi:TPA: hypothetical protein TYI97_002432 [Streptococcus suis]|nr:hypothetical protein [Streptococcus suis]HEP1836096.1 hypothetical protein [Streptococcus suis]